MTALASIAIMAWVLLIGSLADMHDLRTNTAFALGIATLAGPFVALDEPLGRRRG